MYTVRQFREHLREAFNKAEHGEPVLIERYGLNYRLVLTDLSQTTVDNGSKATEQQNERWDIEIPKNNSRFYQWKEKDNITTGNVILDYPTDPTYTDPEEAA